MRLPIPSFPGGDLHALAVRAVEALERISDAVCGHASDHQGIAQEMNALRDEFHAVFDALVR